ncbi:MAG: TolC family protein [Prevotellaceae bacterium]|jgi:outer membrane protein TolC|nr:TolC family protein [Prevotellaceae bacterium]
MNTKHILFAAIFSVACGMANAQQVMTLEKCRELAIENNKSGAIADRSKDKAAYTKRAYRANYFPKISASGSYLYSNIQMTQKISEAYLPTFAPDPATGKLTPNIVVDPAGNPVIGPDGNPIFREYAYFPGMDFTVKLNNLWMVGLSAEQPIYAGGKITAAYRMAKIGEEIAGLSQQLSRAEIIVKTDEAYWMYVQTNELVKLALSYKKTLAELLRSVQAAEETGLKRRNDVLKVQVKMNEAELQLRQAENGVRLSRKNLCYVMGISLDSALQVSEALEVAGKDTMRAVDYSSRPEYVMLEKQMMLKEQEVKLVRSDFLPRVGVMANYGYTSGVMLNNSKLFDKASFSVLASVSIPLFHWGEGHNKIRAAKAERDIARLQQDNIGEQMALELARTLDKCDESALEVELTARSLEQAEENMKLSELQYEGGMETLSGYLETQTVWQRTRMDYINALTHQRLNQTYYLKAAGKL